MPRDEYTPACFWGSYDLRYDARFHPASSLDNVKPLVLSQLRSALHLVQTTDLTLHVSSLLSPDRLLFFINIGIGIILYGLSIAEIGTRCKWFATAFPLSSAC